MDLKAWPKYTSSHIFISAMNKNHCKVKINLFRCNLYNNRFRKLSELYNVRYTNDCKWIVFQFNEIFLNFKKFPSIFFVYFHSFWANLLNKVVDSSGIHTRIFRVEGKHADHLHGPIFFAFQYCRGYVRRDLVVPLWELPTQLSS